MIVARNRWEVLTAVIAAGVSLDFLSKSAVLRTLTPGAIQPFLGEAVQWTLAFNRGAIFGLDPADWIAGFPSGAFFVAVTIVELAVVAWFYGRIDAAQNRLTLAGLALVAAGAAGNLVDRLLGRPGVVDFIRVDLGVPPFDPWPTFNVADIFITVGIGLVLLDSGRRRDVPPPSPGERHRKDLPCDIGGRQ